MLLNQRLGQKRKTKKSVLRVPQLTIHIFVISYSRFRSTLTSNVYEKPKCEIYSLIFINIAVIPECRWINRDTVKMQYEKSGFLSSILQFDQYEDNT